MEFRILGPLEVVEDGRSVALGGRKQRVVLARLLLRANQMVSTSTLIDEVWGDQPPDAVRSSLQSYISHLRKALGDGRIRSGSGGYALNATPDEIDAKQFEALVDQARREAFDDPATAAATFGNALVLWRGPPFADLADELSLLGEIARLDDLRLSATEHKLAAEIAAGRHSAVVGELEELTGRYQLRERLWAQLMLALYRSGRQGEALSAYRRAREVLADELGIDPSPELQELHGRILRQEPELLAPSPGATARTRLREHAPGSTFAGYRIERVIGRGGTSVVYRAEHLRLKRKVALKMLGHWLEDDLSLRERFLRESRLAASLDHPNVVPIYEAGEEDGQPFIAMRYVEGTDLRRKLDEQGALASHHAVSILRQIAAALDAAHAGGLVHRDVKPANVLLAEAAGDDGGENAYLSDFGLTKQTSSGDSSLGGHRFVGTLDYAPPEQFEGKPLDGRADQYSLGCVLYECLTGTPPFRRPNEAALMRAHLDEPAPAVTDRRTDLAAAIDAVVARALAKSPEQRYATCGDLARAASAALGLTDPASAPAVGASPRPRPPEYAGSKRSSRMRRWVAVGTAAVLLAGAAAIVIPRLVGDDASASLTDYGPGMAIIDAATGEGIASIPSAVVQRPVEAIFAGDAFWVLNLEPLSFVQIDPESGRILRQIASPIDDVGYFTVDGNDLWITHFTQPLLVKVDIQLEREVARFDELPGTGGSGGVLVADGSLWVARRDADDGLGILARLDPATGEVEHLFHRLPGSLALAYGDDGAVWTAGSYGDVNRVDPRTNSVTSTNVGGRNFYIAAGAGHGWTTDEAAGVVHQVDSTGTVVATYPTGAGARAVAYSDGVVWVGNQDAGSVTAIDASTGRTTTYLFDHPLDAIAAGAGVVLVQLRQGQAYDGLFEELDGDVARLFVDSYALEPLDPALLATQLGFQVADATCAGLLRRSDGLEGEDELVPEVAAAMPTVSEDGRTYAFTIRRGYRFSPPSDETVTAETFRYSIERALSPRLGNGSPGPRQVSDIEGQAAFRAGEADHISGLRADGETLTITLVASSPDFLERLTTPFFCPVPIETPIISGSGGAAGPVGPATPDVTVLSAGPYYLARYLPGEYTILLGNPNYAGPRPHRFDAIVLREGIDPDQARALVEAGEWDGTMNLRDRNGPVEDVFADRIGCRESLPGGLGVDLAAMCVAGS